MPQSCASSAISTPTPPDKVNRPTLRFGGRRAMLALAAMPATSAASRARCTPYSRSTVSYTASSPASAAVWLAAAWAPIAVRPTFTITTGFFAACAAARARRSLKPSRQPSM